MTGANICGELRNPSEDIPKGTLAAVDVSSATDCVKTMLVGAVAERSVLTSDYFIMTKIAVCDCVILTGIYAATLSSGIATLVGAPRIMQAVAKTDKDSNSVLGYFLAFAVAARCNCVGELKFVARLILEFFMLAQLFETRNSPGWRQVFQYYNKYSCLDVMFLMDWRYAFACVYVYIDFNDSQIKLGSAQSSHVYYEVHTSYILKIEDQVFNIQIVLFAQTLKKDMVHYFFMQYVQVIMVYIMMEILQKLYV